MIKFVFGFVFVLTSFFGMSQSVNFEGEVHFVTTYTYFPKELESYKNFLPVTMDVYLRNNLICQEGPTALANGYQIHIRNLKTNTGYTAMRSGDNSVAYRKTPANFESESKAMPNPTSIEYLSDTRQIAGFQCKKALVFLPNHSQPFTVFYTNQIPSEALVIYKGLKGFPLYFEGNMNGVTYYSEAKSINPTQQEDSKFLLPKDYHVLSYEEFKQALIKDLE